MRTAARYGFNAFAKKPVAPAIAPAYGRPVAVAAVTSFNGLTFSL
jgi:hypothetical protein